MADNQAKIIEVQRKIERERKLLDGNIRMRQATNNNLVHQQLDNSIREGQRGISYLESSLRELISRDATRGVQNMSLGPSSRPTLPQHGRSDRGQQGYAGDPRRPVPSQNSYNHDDGGYGAPQYGGYQTIGHDQGMPARGPFSPGAPGSPSAKPRPNYSKLDLIKHDTPHLGPRIQLMLSQLEFKLSVEKQYKDGIDKIIGSYRQDGDKKIRQEAQGRRTESIQKIQLLQRALKRYEDLHVDMDTTTDGADDDSLNTPNLRKPLTGQLSLRIQAVSEVDHIVGSRFSRKMDTFVQIKIEDELKGKTKSTRTDRWEGETHDIPIDKGNEVELTVYDKSGGDTPMPIGMLWIRISDIAEEMRRRKIEMELQNSGWVSAERTVDDARTTSNLDMKFNAPPGSTGASPNHFAGGNFGVPGQQQQQGQPQSGPVVIDGWFSLEPVGRIHLSMNFAKQTRERKPFDAGLNRKGAIRQRKEDVHEQYGHKFIAQQFYNIMRCALCGELLKYAVGYQCADCKYLCHEKCFSSVVTKCISRPNAESDPDEAKINHRIPHRFEAYGNIGANWCCHCGYMLPLGKKNAKRCKECKLMCHSHCTHLVPDFCGMSMKDANQLLQLKVEAEKNKMTNRTLRPPGRESRPGRPQPATAPSWQPEPADGAQRDRYSYGKDSYGEDSYASRQQQQQTEQQQQRRQDQSSQAASGAALAAFGGTSAGQEQRQAQYRPQAQRNQSSQSAAAAAALALSGKGSSTVEPRPPQSSRQGSYQPASSRPQHEPYNPGRYAEVDRPSYNSTPSQAGTDHGRPPYSATQSQSDVSKQVQLPPQQSAQSAYVAPPVDKFVETRPPQQPTRGTGKRIGLDHFNFLAVLGKGNFGKVMLAETKAAKQLYAIKVLKKEFIIENDEVESTKSERDVFIIANRARHPFLLNLHACFQTETRVYFVMEYISGGDLMLHIQRGQFGTKRAQFYAAEVCLALKYFHENGVVYRDLKLDNILLTLDGHIKIADYGLCKKDMYYGSTTSTFCGTPEFMAPEILLDKRYGRAVDWWAFGVLIYQMLLQQSPFRGEDEDEIYDAILADEPLYPIHMPRDSVSILQKLLTREPEQRLGSGPTDAQEIMSHAFFRNVNWEDVYAKKVPAPFLPQIKSATDTSNFDSEFTSVTPVLTPVNSQLTPIMQEEFRGFSYSADFV